MTEDARLDYLVDELGDVSDMMGQLVNNAPEIDSVSAQHPQLVSPPHPRVGPLVNNPFTTNTGL